jgi:hypothetical protein
VPHVHIVPRSRMPLTLIRSAFTRCRQRIAARLGVAPFQNGCVGSFPFGVITCSPVPHLLKSES